MKEYAKKVKAKWTEKGFDVITPFEVCPIEGMPYNYTWVEMWRLYWAVMGLFFAMTGLVQRVAGRSVM